MVKEGICSNRLEYVDTWRKSEDWCLVRRSTLGDVGVEMERVGNMAYCRLLGLFDVSLCPYHFVIQTHI